MNYAYWQKCDFQVHTPRDPNWQGSRPLGIGDVVDGTGQAVTKADVDSYRNQWANEFVDKCIEKNLEAIAITDHHELVMYKYVKAVVNARKEANPEFNFWVFPGMELTAAGGCQCIIIFDIEISEDEVRQAQARLGIDIANLNEGTAQSPKVTQLTSNYADMAQLLNNIESLKGKYIILPNISQGNSHTVLKESHHADFKRMPYIGGYLDNGQTFDTLSPKNKSRISGVNKDWSAKEIYPLPTSDARSSTYEKLGSNNTWIKLSEPTAEAIRQAFLGRKSRISVGPPQIPSLTVSEINISGSTILNDVSIALSPELNSVIGGRGSGKSSFLEYLAFSIGRSCYDFEREQYSGSSRMSELIKGTLVSKGGKVCASIVQDGAKFQVTRDQSSDFQPVITYPDGTEQNLSSKELRSLFPCVVYSQGELSEIGKQAGKKTQLGDLLQFVNPDYKKEDDQLKQEIENAKLKVKNDVQILVSYWQDQSNLRQLITKKNSVIQRVKALEKTLPQLSDEDQAHLAYYEKVSEFESKRLQASNHAKRIHQDILTLKQELENERDLSSELVDEVKEFSEAYAAFYKTFNLDIQTLVKKLNDELEKVTTAEIVWAAKYQSAKSSRDGALEKLGEHKTATRQIIKLKEEISDYGNQIGVLEQKIKQSRNPSESFAVSLGALRGVVNKRAARTQEWASEIENLSHNRIKASVEAEADIHELMEALSVITAKTGSQETTRLRQLDEALLSESFWDMIDRLRVDCLSLLYWNQLGASEGKELPNCKDLYTIIGDTDRIQSSLSEMIDVARIEAISTATPHPEISLSYCDRGKEISFEKASEGQRATALLFMLLEQEGGPLLIDQPEGDLDNKIIADLTDILHEAKKKRQIIFVSHNANIVVNGSSELVGYIDVSEQGERKFEKVGAIDDSEICDLITTTMEGGEKAFKDRQSKYGY